MIVGSGSAISTVGVAQIQLISTFVRGGGFRILGVEFDTVLVMDKCGSTVAGAVDLAAKALFQHAGIDAAV